MSENCYFLLRLFWLLFGLRLGCSSVIEHEFQKLKAWYRQSLDSKPLIMLHVLHLGDPRVLIRSAGLSLSFI